MASRRCRCDQSVKSNDRGRAYRASYSNKGKRKSSFVSKQQDYYAKDSRIIKIRRTRAGELLMMRQKVTRPEFNNKVSYLWNIYDERYIARKMKKKKRAFCMIK